MNLAILLTWSAKGGLTHFVRISDSIPLIAFNNIKNSEGAFSKDSVQALPAGSVLVVICFQTLTPCPQEFQLDESNVWWVRFSLDYHCETLACGTKNGKVFVWNPHNVGAQPICKMRRATSSKMTVRNYYYYNISCPEFLHCCLLHVPPVKFHERNAVSCSSFMRYIQQFKVQIH